MKQEFSGQLIALLYVRVSSVQQDFESQVHRCTKHASDKGYPVEETFRDKFTGGGDFWRRPAMRALLEYIDKNPHKKYVVIFDDLKRLARDTEFHIRLRKEFKYRDVKVECLNFNFEDSPEGKFVETMFAAQGELEREQNRRQVIQKQKARLERGLWCFDFPPGYKYIQDPAHGKLLVPDEPKASLVREALEGFASNRFPEQTDVQHFLEQRGFYHRVKKNVVHLEQVKRLLTRVLYAGYVEYEPWKVSRKEGKHKGLISLTTFNKIQDKLNGTMKAAARKDIHLDFPARGFVACSECRKPITAAWTTKNNGTYRRPYYRCKTKGCPMEGKSIPKEQLETRLGIVLKRMRAHQEVLDLTKAIALEEWNNRTSNTKLLEERQRQDVSKLGDEINSYLERITKTSNELVIAAYEKKIEELTNQKLALEDKIGKPIEHSGVKLETALEKVFGYVKNPYNIWENGIFEDKRLVLKMVFTEHLVYNKNSGFETATFSLPIRLFQQSGNSSSHLVELGRIALPSKSLQQTNLQV